MLRVFDDHLEAIGAEQFQSDGEGAALALVIAACLDEIEVDGIEVHEPVVGMCPRCGHSNPDGLAAEGAPPYTVDVCLDCSRAMGEVRPALTVPPAGAPDA
jgi:hypothetical protein